MAELIYPQYLDEENINEIRIKRGVVNSYSRISFANMHLSSYNIDEAVNEFKNNDPTPILNYFAQKLIDNGLNVSRGVSMLTNTDKYIQTQLVGHSESLLNFVVHQFTFYTDKPKDVNDKIFKFFKQDFRKKLKSSMMEMY